VVVVVRMGRHKAEGGQEGKGDRVIGWPRWYGRRRQAGNRKVAVNRRTAVACLGGRNEQGERLLLLSDRRRGIG